MAMRIGDGILRFWSMATKLQDARLEDAIHIGGSRRRRSFTRTRKRIRSRQAQAAERTTSSFVSCSTTRHDSSRPKKFAGSRESRSLQHSILPTARRQEPREHASRYFIENYAVAPVSLAPFHPSLFPPGFGEPISAPRNRPRLAGIVVPVDTRDSSLHSFTQLGNEAVRNDENAFSDHLVPELGKRLQSRPSSDEINNDSRQSRSAPRTTDRRAKH